MDPLDFLNTRATPSGVWTQWLTDGADLLAWLEQAGAIAPEVATRFWEQPDARPALDEAAERARDLRRWLRGFVEWHAGREVGKDAVSELGPPNALLARADHRIREGLCLAWGPWRG